MQGDEGLSKTKKDYFSNRESFDELLELMIKYNVFTYGITKTGQKGYEYSNEFRKYFLKTIDTVKVMGSVCNEKELYISTLMTFNNISFELASEMSNVIGGRNISAGEMIREMKNE